MRWRSLVTPLTGPQLGLWASSLACVALASLWGGADVLTLIASLIGATSLIFFAKRNLLGPLLMIVFSVLYGVISYREAYYGEVITYLCMTLPMSVLSLISWARNPVSKDCPQARVRRLTKADVAVMILATAGATIAFYYILAALHTANLPVSTVSVATSFIAAYLTWRRSPWYAVGYAANDAVLIALWLAASAKEAAYGSVVACFAVFLVNDLYGFVAWKKAAPETEGAADKA